MAVFGIVYKMGVFASLWSIFKNGLIISFFLFIMYQFNAKKKISIERRVNDKVIETTEHIVPKFSPIITGDAEDQTIMAVIANVVCVIIIVIAFICM